MVEMIEKGGATYIGEDVVVDGNIVTASAPGAAEAFGKTLAEELAKRVG